MIQASKLESSSQAKGDLKRSNIKVNGSRAPAHCEKSPENVSTLKLSAGRSIPSDLREPKRLRFDLLASYTADFVRQHYHDFLNREPDPAGLAFWTSQITSCGTDAVCTELKRINVSAAFFLSIEFQATGGTAYLTNKVAYGGMPTYLRFETDVQAIGRNYVFGQPGPENVLETNTMAYFKDYVSRPEFMNTYNGLSDHAYVNTLISNTGVEFTQSERDALLNGLLNHTETRATVLRKISEKPGFAQAEFNRMFVLTQYFGYLRRNPNEGQDTDYTGYDFWLSKLNRFSGNFMDAEMVRAFINSLENRRRFEP